MHYLECKMVVALVLCTRQLLSFLGVFVGSLRLVFQNPERHQLRLAIGTVFDRLSLQVVFSEFPSLQRIATPRAAAPEVPLVAAIGGIILGRFADPSFGILPAAKRLVDPARERQSPSRPGFG